jgi:diguanylate cyclase
MLTESLEPENVQRVTESSQSVSGTVKSRMSSHARRGGVALQFLFVAATRLGTLLAVVSIVAALAAAWAATYAAGGSHTAMPHLFYVPVILGAVRFSWSGGALAAVVAGLLVGPAMPADVAAGTPQPLQGWLLRLVMFLGIGLFVAWVLRDRSDSIGRSFHDTLVTSRLLQALQRGHVEVHYQPIFNMENRRIVGVEALARWTDPRRGIVIPGEFIPAAERIGAIAELDRFVLEQTVQQVGAWSAEFGPITASVNVSANRFAHDDLCREVHEVLARSGLPAEHLQLELTESAFIQDMETSRAQIARLRRAGVKVAIDDFGAGQASLSYLTTFTVDTVKIDRSLVERVAEEPRTARLVAGMIQLFEAIELRTVAEGVETAEQYVHLESAGCRLAQGYYTGRPVPADQMSQILARERRAVTP